MANINLDKMQKVVDRAYEKWPKGRSFKDFLMELDVKERDAVIIGKLHYQVGNGGFSQWIFNGYASDSEFLFSAIEKIKTDNANEVAKIVRKVLKKAGNDPDNFYINEADYDGDIFESLDDAYYEIGDQFMLEAQEALV